MDEIDVRPSVADDALAISRVIDAQDTAWWGEPDGDVSDDRDELGRTQLMVDRPEATDSVGRFRSRHAIDWAARSRT